jgi:hypothetical protein
MKWETKAKIIMAILTGPIWLACMMLLSVAYLVALSGNAADRFKRMEFDQKLFTVVYLAILCCGLLAFITQPIAERPTQAECCCMANLTRIECKTVHLRTLILMFLAVSVTGLAAFVFYMWKIGQCIVEIIRREAARVPAAKAARESPERQSTQSALP